MKIQTSRFGDLEIDKKDILTFSEGILGFENLKDFFIVDPGDNTLILWLQSLQEKGTAFPIIEPKIFNKDYNIKLLPSELNSLSLAGLSEACIYTILTIPKDDVTKISANLKAPIVINIKLNSARQIVLQDSKLEVRHEIYSSLKKNLLSSVSDDSKRVELHNTLKESIGSAEAVSSIKVNTLKKKSKKDSRPLNIE